MALFNQLSDELFKPLAATNRRLYGALLLHLHRKTMDVAGEAPKRADVIREIGAFLDDWERDNGALSAEDGDDGSPEGRRYAVYQRLVDAGWLSEHRDRYLKLVDFDPEAHLLLQELDRIDRGERRSYGGTVLQVLSALESAAANPREMSESLSNAARSAREFMQHARTVSASMRKVEDRVVAQEGLRDIFRSYFEEFVQRHLIVDFKTLHTKNNPFRFRATIIRRAHEIAHDALLVRALCEAYVREGRAPSEADAEAAVIAELDEVIRVFENVDRHLEAIDDTNHRLERRIASTVRYMDRVNDRRLDRVMEAMRAVASAPLSPLDEIDVPLAMTPLALPVGPSHIPAPRPPRVEIGIQRVRQAERDPAFERFQAAKQDYQRKVGVSEAAIEDAIARMMGTKSELRASEAEIEDVETFVAFQRLRELPFLFGGRLADRYEIEILEERCVSPWLDCPDFVVRRREERIPPSIAAKRRAKQKVANA
jgi:hypothetical protein